MVLLLLFEVQKLAIGWTKPQLIVTSLHVMKFPKSLHLPLSPLSYLPPGPEMFCSFGGKQAFLVLCGPWSFPSRALSTPTSIKPSSGFSLFPTLYPLAFSQCLFLPMSLPVFFLAFEMPSHLQLPSCKASPFFKAWLFHGTLYCLRYGFAAYDKPPKSGLSRIEVYLSLM